MSLGGVFTAAAQVKQGQIARAQGQFEEEIQERNQAALERQAAAEKEAASVEESRIARRSKIVQARLSVGQSKSGIGLAGATLSALTDAAFQFSLDRSLTLRAGLLKSRELIQRGKILRAQGKFADAVGRSKRDAFFLGAIGTALGSGPISQSGPQTTQSTSPSGPSSTGDLNTGTTTSSGRIFA
jgi:hypothetical protein